MTMTTNSMPTVTAIELLEDRTARSRCDEGFLRLKRLTAQNRRADGSTSRPYPIDLIDRPALDAVAVVVWARTARGIEVLTRLQLRPAAGFRDPAKAVLPEAQGWFVEEVVAGVIEPGEKGEEGRASVVAVIDGALRSARIRADTEVEVDRLSREAFDDLDITHPAIKLKLWQNLTRSLCDRLRKATRELSLFD